MSGELARIGDDPLSEQAAAEQVRRLHAAREYVRNCPGEAEALEAKRQAELVRHWARINKASGEIAREACKLQATALRRLCELQSSSVSGQEREAGEWLASLGDREFDALLASMRYAKSPITLYKDHLRKLEEQKVFQRGRDIGSGEAGTPVDYESVARAANDVLHAALAGGAVTVNEITDRLAEELYEYGVSSVLREGIQSIVREALRNETFDDEDHPDFITWKDAEAGWLRIPWAAATVPQLRWMAEFRQEQARELKAAADDLTALADAMEQTAHRHRLTRLSDIWQAFVGGSKKSAA